MVYLKPDRPMFWKVLTSVILALLMAMTAHPVVGQTRGSKVSDAKRSLPTAVDQAIKESNRAAYEEFEAIQRQWREVFRQSRSRERLKGFVDETMDVFEKLRQVQDLALNPGATEIRVGALFRKHIMDEARVSQLLEDSYKNYCRILDEQDQALLIKLKIDRDIDRKSLSRGAVDPAVCKRAINAAASSAVAAVQKDLSRSVVSLVASEVVSTGVKRAARNLGVMPGEQGSLADFVSGLLIDIGVGMAVDAVSDPTAKMVADLEAQLAAAERQILDGTDLSPGFFATLRRVTDDRVATRRKLIEAALLK